MSRALFIFATAAILSPGAVAQIPGTDCCQGTDPANTCYAWFQADVSNVCPDDSVARDSCDCHMPEDASGNIALSMEECCRRTCHSSGFTQ